MQGGLRGSDEVIGSVKHFVGDGGTWRGKDQGENRASRADMINVHAQGYYGALGAGVQTVMASYNTWNDVAAGKDGIDVACNDGVLRVVRLQAPGGKPMSAREFLNGRPITKGDRFG